VLRISRAAAVAKQHDFIAVGKGFYQKLAYPGDHGNQLAIAQELLLGGNRGFDRLADLMFEIVHVRHCILRLTHNSWLTL